MMGGEGGCGCEDGSMKHCSKMVGLYVCNVCGRLLFWRPGYTYTGWQWSGLTTTQLMSVTAPLPSSLSEPPSPSPSLPPLPSLRHPSLFPPPPPPPLCLPLAHCRNSLAAEEQVSYLALCPALRSLTLDGNPVCRHMARDEVRGGVVGVACMYMHVVCAYVIDYVYTATYIQ